MNFKLINKISLVSLFGFIIMLSACKKENDVTITETEEPIELGFKMAINDTNIETDAFAAYCENDTSSFLIIANKQENLVFPLQTQNFEANDFVYMLGTNNSSTWGYGGQALGEDVTGNIGALSIQFSDAELQIESNDRAIVVGSAEGMLGVYPYQMDFVAEIVQESDFCE